MTHVAVNHIGPPTHPLIDKIRAILTISVSHGLRDALIGELPQFFVLVGVTADVDLLTWWFNEMDGQRQPARRARGLQRDVLYNQLQRLRNAPARLVEID